MDRDLVLDCSEPPSVINGTAFTPGITDKLDKKSTSSTLPSCSSLNRLNISWHRKRIAVFKRDLLESLLELYERFCEIAWFENAVATLLPESLLVISCGRVRLPPANSSNMLACLRKSWLVSRYDSCRCCVALSTTSSTSIK